MDGDAGQAASGRWAPPGPGPSHCFLRAAGPVLQPLERLKEQGTAGPWLLALAGSKRGSGTGGSEEQRPAEDQCDEARACLHTAPDPHQATDMLSPCPAHPQPSFPPSLLLCPKAFVSTLWFPRASSALATLLPLSVTTLKSYFSIGGLADFLQSLSWALTPASSFLMSPLVWGRVPTSDSHVTWSS